MSDEMSRLAQAFDAGVDATVTRFQNILLMVERYGFAYTKKFQEEQGPVPNPYRMNDKS